MNLDVIRAIEACYAPVADEATWLAGIGEALAPLDAGLGGAALTYDASDPARFRLETLVTVGEAGDLRGPLEAFHHMGCAEQIRAMYWHPPPCGSLVATLGSVDPTTAALARGYLEAASYPDIFAVHGVEPDHRGLLVGFAGRRRVPSPLHHRLACLAAHLSTAYRLRTALGGLATPDAERTEAVLDPSGRVADARAGARPAAARARLGEALRRVERARGGARRASQDEAVLLWRGLVDGTWSLVDHWESDGRRRVLAVRNAPGVADPRALTPRERDVLAFALMGRSNKWIAYTLGLAPSTVSEHLALARRKLGARSRAELILAVSGAGAPDPFGPDASAPAP
jgi:DNA-binding CsgD family transcriptional regulator